jgi:hypothetical protein
MFVADLYQEMIDFGLGVFADGSDDSLQELQRASLEQVLIAIVLVIVDARDLGFHQRPQLKLVPWRERARDITPNSPQVNAVERVNHLMSMHI